MGVAERRAREKQELRRRILDAATELFVAEGFQQVSMRRIAQRIEYSPSTIYLYFKDKTELLQSICAETFAQLDAALEAINVLELPPLDKMRQSLATYIEFGLTHPNHYLVSFCIPEAQIRDLAGEQHARIHEVAMCCFERLRAGLCLCQEAGVMEFSDLELAAQSIWMMIHGVTSALLTVESFPFLERRRLIEESVDRLLRAYRGGTPPAANS